MGEYGIRVSCVAPAMTLTARVKRNLPPERLEHIAQMTTLRRNDAPDDTAQAAVCLASEAASGFSGVTLDVAGSSAML